jgi:hypothetical protein
MTKKNIIHIIRESYCTSLLSDVTMFGLMLLTCWLNYKFIDGNNFIDAVLIFGVLLICGNALNLKKYTGVSEAKLKQIEKILERKND